MFSYPIDDPNYLFGDVTVVVDAHENHVGSDFEHWIPNDNVDYSVHETWIMKNRFIVHY